jgi:hypothetical protein
MIPHYDTQFDTQLEFDHSMTPSPVTLSLGTSDYLERGQKHVPHVKQSEGDW